MGSVICMMKALICIEIKNMQMKINSNLSETNCRYNFIEGEV